MDRVRKATLWRAKTSNRILPKVSPFVPLDYLQVMNKFEVLPIKTELALRDKKHRITAVDAEQVNFTYKDYRDGATTKTMTLRNKGFIQHFA